MFSLSNVGPNLARYPRWITVSHTPFIWVSLAAPFWIVRRAAHRPLAWASVVLRGGGVVRVPSLRILPAERVVLHALSSAGNRDDVGVCLGRRPFSASIAGAAAARAAFGSNGHRCCGAGVFHVRRTPRRVRHPQPGAEVSARWRVRAHQGPGECDSSLPPSTAEASGITPIGRRSGGISCRPLVSITRWQLFAHRDSNRCWWSTSGNTSRFGTVLPHPINTRSSS